MIESPGGAFIRQCKHWRILFSFSHPPQAKKKCMRILSQPQHAAVQSDAHKNRLPPRVGWQGRPVPSTGRVPEGEFESCHGAKNTMYYAIFIESQSFSLSSSESLSLFGCAKLRRCFISKSESLLP